MENRQINEHYAEIAKEIIETEESLASIAASQASIIFLSSDHEKKAKDKKTCGECEKINDKYKWSIPADFTITVFEPNITGFSEDQLRVLLFHELLHVGVEFKEDGTERYFIRDHDYEDFKEIIDRYGTEWSETK